MTHISVLLTLLGKCSLPRRTTRRRESRHRSNREIPGEYATHWIAIFTTRDVEEAVVFNGRWAIRTRDATVIAWKL